GENRPHTHHDLRRDAIKQPADNRSREQCRERLGGRNSPDLFSGEVELLEYRGQKDRKTIVTDPPNEEEREEQCRSERPGLAFLIGHDDSPFALSNQLWTLRDARILPHPRA